MGELAKRDIPVTREVWARDDAVKFFLDMGEKYKAELIAAIPADQDVSLYREGDFIDLCRGPHVPSTGKPQGLQADEGGRRLLGGDAEERTAAAHLRHGLGEEGRPRRLPAHAGEAEKRDHRKVGRHLDLFHMQDEAPGLVFWHPKGWAVWQEIEQYMRRVYRDNGYQEVRCPQMLDRTLWEKSGHWENYKGQHVHHGVRESRLRVKPMNCPGHIQVFNAGLRSYRELPLRYGEFGSCHRNEPRARCTA